MTGHRILVLNTGAGSLSFIDPIGIWFEAPPDLEPERLVFIDETGASTKMARRYGRARRGERCRAAVPYGHWKTTTFVGALRLEGMTAPMVLDGAIMTSPRQDMTANERKLL